VIDCNAGDLEGMIVGVRPWWGCSNASCCAKFSLCLVGLWFFHKQRHSNRMLYSKKQDIDETSVGLAGHVEEGDE
jgi:hypothetical protein